LIISEVVFPLQDDAQLKYIELINSLVSSDSSADSADPTTSGKYTTLDVTNQNGVCKIQLNRPKKKNAITIDVSGCFWLFWVHRFKPVEVC